MASHDILVVDDEESLAFFLQQSLLEGNKDWRVEIAESAEEALTKLNHHRYEVIIADLRMPGVNGLELVVAVRSIDPATRVILMTAYGSDAIEAEARRLQVYEYVTKPFKMEAMCNLVQSALSEIAISRKGVFVLSDGRFEAVSKSLSSLRFEVGAQCLFLADVMGQVITEVGVRTSLDLAALTSLLSSSFAATSEMSRHLGGKQTFNLHYHEGEGYDLYASNIGENLVLAIVFDKKVQAGRIGTVWPCMKRTLEELLRLTTAPELSTEEELAEDLDQTVTQAFDHLFSPTTSTTKQGPTTSPRPGRTPPPHKLKAAARVSSRPAWKEAKARGPTPKGFDL
jgi:DNA-binding response OmpR family regulator